jgi:hypothetical protein
LIKLIYRNPYSQCPRISKTYCQKRPKKRTETSNEELAATVPHCGPL